MIRPFKFARCLPRRPISTGAGTNGEDAQVKPGAGNRHHVPGNPRKSIAFYDEDYSLFLGFGSCHDLAESDLRNPRLAGLKSVSHAAATAMGRRDRHGRIAIGFHRPWSGK